MSAAKLLSLGAAVKSAAAVAVKSMVLPGIAGTGALHVTEHVLKVPVDHSDHSAFPPIDVFVREVCLASKADEEQPYLLYLQGGPGFPSPRPTCPPSGWMHAALSKNFRVLLLDQRGTGRSSPITAESLTSLECLDAEPERMAAYLSHFRADSIVRDCELVREAVAKGKKLTLLGQSFGGFCILTYLSNFPNAVERALFTFGLAPTERSAEEVYTATFKRMEERNRRFYRRYPGDIELVRSIVAALHIEPVPLPRGGTLTVRRFLQLGALLGSASGMETLHDLLEGARAAWGDGPALPVNFLIAVENAQVRRDRR
jgi:pimeloyl-ACP methyl ester carboxylesterase